METDLTWREKRLERELREQVERPDRYVDIGVALRTVVADPNGRELLDGKPRMRVIAEQRFGGILDTALDTPGLIGPSRDPVIWHCSEDQAPIVLHGDDLPLFLLAYGSEGAGKSTAIAMWHYFRWLEHLGERREGGCTAPTNKRLEMVRGEMVRIYPAAWFRYSKVDQIIDFVDGTRIALVSTHRQSADEGSRVQGYSFSWTSRDELQDQLDVHEDLQARGRAAKRGRYKQLGTATAKDNPKWREFKDVLLAAVSKGGEKMAARYTMLGRRSPFVDASFWDAMEATMSEREYRRRVLAEDVGPERETYHAWDREKNLIRIPELWDDCTALELAAWGANLTGLGGHDPGTLWDVTLILKAFRPHPRALPSWIVVDEINTEQSTTEQHVAKLLERIRGTHRMNLLDRHGRTSVDGNQLFTRADPYSDSANDDDQPDRSVYTIFRGHGLRILPATFSKKNPTKPGRVPKNAGIDMVNTLFCNARGERRLFVAKDERGRPCAPKLVESIESSARDTDGKAETQKKNKADISHWTATLRYALWSIERPRLEQIRQQALAAA